MKKVVVRVSCPPYGHENAFSALYVALTSVAKGLEVKVVLVQDGIFAALKGQQEPPKTINMPSVEEQIRDLIDLEVRVILDKQAAEARGVKQEELIGGTEILDLAEIQDMILDDGELIVGF